MIGLTSALLFTWTKYATNYNMYNIYDEYSAYVVSAVTCST